MSEPLYVYLYGGATCEDLYAEQDSKNYDLTLELMSSPQCAFVATEYSQELIDELARDMWDEIAELYQPDHDVNPKGIEWTFEDLKVVTSAKVAERPEGFEGPLPVKEATTIEYYLHQTVEPLFQIVVQVRPMRRPGNRTRSLAELLPDFGAAPGDN